MKKISLSNMAFELGAFSEIHSCEAASEKIVRALSIETE